MNGVDKMVEKVSIKFDEDNLTLGDLEDFEEAAGQPLFEALKPVNVLNEDGTVKRDPETGEPEQEVNLSAKAMKALVWITLRNERDGFTLEDARAVKVAALEFVTDAPRAEGNEAGEAVAPQSNAPETPHVPSVQLV